LPVSNQFNVAAYLLDRMNIKFIEISGNAEDTRRIPVNRVSSRLFYDFLNEKIKFGLMIHEPIKVIQPLVDNVFMD